MLKAVWKRDNLTASPNNEAARWRKVVLAPRLIAQSRLKCLPIFILLNFRMILCQGRGSLDFVTFLKAFLGTFYFEIIIHLYVI